MTKWWWADQPLTVTTHLLWLTSKFPGLAFCVYHLPRFFTYINPPGALVWQFLLINVVVNLLLRAIHTEINFSLAQTQCDLFPCLYSYQATVWDDFFKTFIKPLNQNLPLEFNTIWILHGLRLLNAVII